MRLLHIFTSIHHDGANGPTKRTSALDLHYSGLSQTTSISPFETGLSTTLWLRGAVRRSMKTFLNLKHIKS